MVAKQKTLSRKEVGKEVGRLLDEFMQKVEETEKRCPNVGEIKKEEFNPFHEDYSKVIKLGAIYMIEVGKWAEKSIKKETPHSKEGAKLANLRVSYLGNTIKLFLQNGTATNSDAVFILNVILKIFLDESTSSLPNNGNLKEILEKISGKGHELSGHMVH